VKEELQIQDVMKRCEQRSIDKSRGRRDLKKEVNERFGLEIQRKE